MEAGTFSLNIKISEPILAYQFIKTSPRDDDYEIHKKFP